MFRKIFLFISNLVIVTQLCAMKKDQHIKDTWCKELLPLTTTFDEIMSHRQTVDTDTDDEQPDYEQVNASSTAAVQQLHCQQALLFAILLHQGITDFQRRNDEEPEANFLVFAHSYEKHINALAHSTSSYDPLLPDKITETNLRFAALLKIKLFDLSLFEKTDFKKLKKSFTDTLPAKRAKKLPSDINPGIYCEARIEQWINAYTRASRHKFCYDIQERNCNIAQQALQFLNFYDEISQGFYDRVLKTTHDIQFFFTQQQQMIDEQSLQDQSDFSLYWHEQESLLEARFQRFCKQFNNFEAQTIVHQIQDFRTASTEISKSYGPLIHPILQASTIDSALHCAQQTANFADKLEEKLRMRLSKPETTAAHQSPTTDGKWRRG